MIKPMPLGDDDCDRCIYYNKRELHCNRFPDVERKFRCKYKKEG